jgi:DNA-binding winged helix-turn-helix (wHTH) protein
MLWSCVSVDRYLLISAERSGANRGQVVVNRIALMHLFDARERPMRILLSDGHLDLTRGEVVREGHRESLTPMEIGAVQYMARQPGVVVKRVDLERDVWGMSASVRSDAVVSAMKRLRSKIEVDPSTPQHLKTVRGVGWVLDPVVSDRSGPLSNLVAPALSFIGRGEELSQLQVAIQTRFVEVAGLGGIGKSRLAVEAALQLVDEFPAGICCVDAKGVANHLQLLAQLTGTLPNSDEAAQAWLSEQTASDALLLLVENMESAVSPDKLIEALRDWVAGTANLAVVYVSRRQFGMRGVTSHRVERLSDADAEALFLARSAITISPDSPIEQLVSGLEGHPLALEFAASRMTVVSPADLVRKMSDRMEWLTSRDPSHLPRHASMQAVLGASWDIASESTRDALAQCCVFHGDFQFADAEAVLGPDAMDLLEEVAKHCWLSIRSSASGRTYRVPSMVRDYVANERPVPNAVTDRFADYCAQITVTRYMDDDAFVAPRRLTIDDLFAVAKITNLSDRVLGIIGSDILARLNEADRDAEFANAADVLIGRLPPSSPWRAMLLVVKATWLWSAGNGDGASSAVHEALQLCEEGPPLCQAFTHAHASSLFGTTGRWDDAVASSTRALEIGQASGFPAITLWQLAERVSLLTSKGQHEQARDTATELVR